MCHYIHPEQTYRLLHRRYHILHGVLLGYILQVLLLFCIASYSIITVYAVGDVLSKNIRRRFDTDYRGYMLYIVGCSSYTRYTLSIVYSLVCSIILIVVYTVVYTVITVYSSDLFIRRAIKVETVFLFIFSLYDSLL